MAGEVTETDVHLRAIHPLDTMPNCCITQECSRQPHHWKSQLTSMSLY